MFVVGNGYEFSEVRVVEQEMSVPCSKVFTLCDGARLMKKSCSFYDFVLCF